jgi:hypothetical protein
MPINAINTYYYLSYEFASWNINIFRHKINAPQM